MSNFLNKGSVFNKYYIQCFCCCIKIGFESHTNFQNYQTVDSGSNKNVFCITGNGVTMAAYD